MLAIIITWQFLSTLPSICLDQLLQLFNEVGRPGGKSISQTGVAEIIVSKEVLITYRPSLLNLWPTDQQHLYHLEAC